MKYIYIGAITRSGGSLLARLFDGHRNVGSYPVEIDWKLHQDFYPFVEAISGAPTFIPEYTPSINNNALVLCATLIICCVPLTQLC